MENGKGGGEGCVAALVCFKNRWVYGQVNRYVNR